ncbi:MAG TPA: alpha/beta hydrolase [Chthoniobacterales bacterium]|nr:alpha/beta hydrolase [Chthoniobacterales bacterium]
MKFRYRKPSGRVRAATYIVLYLALITISPLPDRLVLFPTTYRIDAGAAVRKPIPFEDGELEIWTAQSRLAKQRGQAEIYVLRFYGNADRADRWVADEAEMWNNRAVEVWGANYPGFGGSTGPARLARLGPAALAAFDALKQTAGDRPIVVFGASLGTTTALHIAAQRKVAGLILHNPVALRQIILRQFGWWNLWLFAGPMAQKIPRDLDSITNAKASRVPAIFLLAEKDEVVAPKYQRLVVAAYAGEKRNVTLAGARHNNPLDGASIANFLDALDWLLPRQPE